MKKLSLLSFIAMGKKNQVKAIKILFVALLFCFSGYSGYANVVVTAASGGTNICPTLAVGGGATAYTALGSMSIAEGVTSDLSTGPNVITLAPPAGWKFNTGVAPILAFGGGADITSITSSYVGGNLVVTVNCSGVTNFDAFSITGLQVEATSTASIAGYVYSSVAFVPGIVTGSGGTDFADLSLATGTTPSVSISATSTTICAGSNVTFTPTPTNGGVGPSYHWFVNGVSVGFGGTFSSSLLNNGDVVTCVMTAGVGGCFFPLTATSNSITMTVNPLPTTVTASGGGSFCGSTTISGANGGSGTIFFQNTTSGGTSTILGGTPQVVAASGTYYFRAESVAGCWGNQGAVTVTINPVPNAVSVSGGTVTCGTPQTITASLVGAGTIFFQGTTSGGTSTILGGTPQTVATSGTYYFRAESGGGCWGGEGSTVVTINPLPTAYAVTGGGGYCAGGTGVTVGLAKSDIGVTYQLFQGGVGTGIFVAGTGSAISFGLQFAAANYTVQGTNTTTLCTNNMTGSVNVVINPLPAVYSMTGGGSYCAGGSGIVVGLSFSSPGVNYQLYRGGFPTPTIVGGTGIAISFGLQTIAGTYTAVATDGNGCTSNMGGTAVVGINPLPPAFSVTGGGGYCSGGTGSVVGLGGSFGGDTYQLFVDGVLIGSTVPGTGGAITFGLQTTGGTYTVVATDNVTLCTNNMTGSVTVTINPLPNAYTVIGGGGYCTGGTGVNVGLSSSDIGVSYQLFRGITLVTTVPGSGFALDFGAQTVAGTYTVVATNTTTFCTNNMTGSVIVTINPLPLVFNVTGGGSYCAGGPGLDLTLSGSEVGVDYQVYKGLLPVGSPVPGTGIGTLDLGFQTAGGVYTAVATNTTTTCVSNMTGSATIVVDPLPIVYTVTGGGPYCSGGTGVHIGLSGSDLGITYQLLQGLVVVDTKAGTGAALDFGLWTVAGSYTVVATNLATTCTSNMTGTATVSINALPNIYTVTSFGINSYCAGGTGVDIFLAPTSDLGINYQLYLNGVPVAGAVLAGNNAILDFGPQTLAGTYTIVATDAVTGCTNNMSGSVVLTIDPLPTAFSVTGGGPYCAGGTGVAVGLANSTTGINYELFLGGVTTGIIVGGTTGSPITFGLQTAAGIYTVVATNTITTCTNNMTGSVTITINPLPTVYVVSGGGAYCAGGPGVDIQLNLSDVGFNYQLFNGLVPISTMAGTGSLLDFGLQTGAGTYSIVSTNTVTGCTNNMSGNPVIMINPLPTLFTVTGGGSYCMGGTGVHVGLDNSTTGVSYQLMNAFLPVGLPLPGSTGLALDFGLQTASGFYTVIATDNTTFCSDTMTGGVAVTIIPLPTAYNMTGGGAYCAGGTGADVGLSGSDFNTNYELFLGGVTTGIIMSGTGGALDFGLQTSTGVYTIVATNTITTCTNNMSGTSSVSINPLPTQFNVSGGGDYCFGGAGLHVFLSGSLVGTNYELFVGIVSTGIIMAGTGSALDFGAQTVAGNYTVVATNTATTCTNNMLLSATIVIDPLPTVYAVTGGGPYCAGGAGIDIGLFSSDLGVTYQLYLGGVPVLLPIAGTGSALDFGFQTAAGNYTIVGTNDVTGCTNNMSGSAVVVMNPLPTVYTLTGGGPYCAGGTGSPIILSFSDIGINYQPYIGALAIGSPVAGTGSPLFILETTAGTYTIVATNTTTGCSDTMSSTSTVSINPLPAAITGVTNECIGTTTTLNDATGGGTWSSDNTLVAAIDPGTGLVTTVSAGTYNVSYTLIATGCLVSSLDTVDALPAVTPIIGVSNVCAGNSALFVDATPGGVWSSSDPLVASIDAFGMVTGVSGGTVTLTYDVTSVFGCDSFVTAPLTILPQPVVSAITGALTNVCTGLTTALNDATPGGVWSSSDNTLATVGTAGVVTGIAPGVVTISYSVTNIAGCTGSALYTMTIGNPMPSSVALPLGSATLCHGNPVTLSVVTAGSGLTYQWNMSGTPIPGATDSSYVTLSGGTFTAVISNGTCSEALPSINVVLPPIPVIAMDTAGNLLFTGSFTSYQWYLNGDTIRGATSSTIPVGAGGNYTVVVSDGNGCFDTSAMFVIIDTTVTTTHVGNVVNSKDIRIYPNPATSILYIDAPEKVYVTVLTTDGKILMGQKEAISLNVGELANGMYIIMVYDENNVLLKTDKFVKMQ